MSQQDILINLVRYALFASVIAMGVFFACYPSRFFSNGKGHVVRNQKSRTVMFCCLFAAIILVLVSSLRYNVGSDYQTYMSLAKAYSNDYNSIASLFSFQTMKKMNFQIGYPIVSIISYQLFGSQYAVFFIVACLIYFPTMIYFALFSSSPYYSLFTFLMFGLWGFSLNALKQAIAMVVILYAFECIRRRRIIAFLVLGAVAFSFHTSAIVAIAGLVVAQFLRAKKRTLILAIIAGVILRVFFYVAVWFVNHLSILSKYKGYFDSTVNASMNRTFMIVGIMIQFMLVLWLVLLSIKRKKELYKINPEIDSYIAVLIVAIPFFVAGLSRTIWIIYRFSLYFTQFITILIPAVLGCIKEDGIEKYVVDARRRDWIRVSLVGWNFFYALLMLDNNTFVIDTILRH